MQAPHVGCAEHTAGADASDPGIAVHCPNEYSVSPATPAVHTPLLSHQLQWRRASQREKLPLPTEHGSGHSAREDAVPSPSSHEFAAAFHVQLLSNWQSEQDFLV